MDSLRAAVDRALIAPPSGGAPAVSNGASAAFGAMNGPRKTRGVVAREEEDEDRAEVEMGAEDFAEE